MANHSVRPQSMKFGLFAVDVEMQPFEQRELPEVVALSRSDELLRRLTVPEDYAHISDLAAIGPMGDPSGRMPIDGADIPREKLAVIIVAGQSNSANSAAPNAQGEFYERPDLPIFNLNIGDGRCYRARNPLLGADGECQAFALPLAAQLIDAGLYEAVLLAPIGVGRTWIEEWVPGAHHFARFERALAGISALGLQPSFVLWHQGESNAGVLFGAVERYEGTYLAITRAAARLSYLRNLLTIAAGLRAANVTAPILVARATVCGSIITQTEIHAAQSTSIATTPRTGIFAGPDTDALPFAGRFDGCHFAHDGNLAHASAWFEALRQCAAVLPVVEPA